MGLGSFVTNLRFFLKCDLISSSCLQVLSRVSDSLPKLIALVPPRGPAVPVVKEIAINGRESNAVEFVDTLASGPVSQ